VMVPPETCRAVSR